MSWRSRRQGTYFGIFGLIVLALLTFILYPIFNKPPTCSDKKQNGTETGVDCGGSCALYCPKSIALPRVDFAAVFPVDGDVYNAVALLTSTAPNAGARNAAYTFTFYDEAGKIINESKGNTFIPAASQFAVFSAGIRTGERTPVRARFTWDENVIYFEKIKLNSNTLPLEESSWTRNTVLGMERVSVNLQNNSFTNIPESEYIVIVYDKDDEPIAASKTVSVIPARSNQELFFSWPYEFKTSPKRYELIKRVNPFNYAK
jgi:hypothetical protein